MEELTDHMLHNVQQISDDVRDIRKIIEEDDDVATDTTLGEILDVVRAMHTLMVEASDSQPDPEAVAKDIVAIRSLQEKWDDIVNGHFDGSYMKAAEFAYRQAQEHSL